MAAVQDHLVADRVFDAPVGEPLDHRLAPAAPALPGGPSPRLAGWTGWLGAPAPEPAWSRRWARAGGLAALTAIAVYVCWRILFTLPADPGDRRWALLLIAFEALPMIGIAVKVVTLWSIDAPAPPPIDVLPADMRVAVLIPTYNEPFEVLSPTVAAACAIEPVHETWVLDDGERAWVAEMCAELGARYVCRPVHDHAKAGNLNHALALMSDEAATGAAPIDVIAVLDCDHVPLPTFLTSTLGWFADERIALVQGPQAFYNAGAFDDDGYTGEQGLFFNVLMPARHHAEAGPFWCGSTSLIRVRALGEIGGVATETITEDLHTTLKLIRAGWRTAYHHQTLAVGLAPATPDQYLVQRRRWGMGAMQILVHERLWAAKRWMSWRNFVEYLNGTLFWLEGAATVLAFAVPIIVMFSGAETSTAPPLAFALAFTAMFVTRLWGAKRLLRGQIRWSTAFALRVFRVPVGIACVWWLVTRRSLEFEVTPKGASDERRRGRSPRILVLLSVLVLSVTLYGSAGAAGLVPWYSEPGSTLACAVWLALGAVILAMGSLRIRRAEFATSRRNAHRVPVRAAIRTDGRDATLLDVSVGGVKVATPAGALPDAGVAAVDVPGCRRLHLEIVRVVRGQDRDEASLRVRTGEWHDVRELALWMFHTPAGAVPGLPAGVPVAAIVAPT